LITSSGLATTADEVDSTTTVLGVASSRAGTNRAVSMDGAGEMVSVSSVTVSSARSTVVRAGSAPTASMTNVRRFLRAGEQNESGVGLCWAGLHGRTVQCRCWACWDLCRGDPLQRVEVGREALLAFLDSSLHSLVVSWFRGPDGALSRSRSRKTWATDTAGVETVSSVTDVRLVSWSWMHFFRLDDFLRCQGDREEVWCRCRSWRPCPGSAGRR
jgi:hypothetical protein